MYRFAINRPIATLMLFVSLVFFGIFALRHMSIDLFPDVEIPFVKITTYAAGDRNYIESKITKKIEDEVSALGGIKKIYSKSYDNLSVVVVEFELSQDIDVAANDIRDKVDRARVSGQSEIEKISGSNAPIFSIFLSSKKDDQTALMQKVDSVAKDFLQRINGVGKVDSVGFSQPQVKILLNPAKLNAQSLSADMLSQIIQSQNLKIPLGKLENDSKLISLKSNFDATSIQELKDILLKPGVFLGDVADISMTIADIESKALMNQQQGVMLNIIKVRGANSLKTIQNVRSKLDEFGAVLGDEFEYFVAYDKSSVIQKHLFQVAFDMVLGTILTVLIVFVFLRSVLATIISAIAIPVSIIGTFFIIYVLGYDLNRLTLVALTLGIGIFVDDAIVVIENITKKLNSEHDSLRASFEGVREIAFSVLAVSAVLLCVFVPIAFMDGIVGRYFNSFAMSVAGGVCISFVVCIMLIPSFAARLLKAKESRLYLATEPYFLALENGYGKLLELILRNKLKFVFLSFAVLFICMSLALKVGDDFMPVEDNSEFQILLKSEPSVSLKAMQERLEPINKFIKDDTRVKYSYTLIGYDDAKSAYKAKIYIGLKPLGKERSQRQSAIQDEYRKALKYPELSVTVVPLPVVETGDITEPVQLVITGASLDVFEKITPEVKALLNSIDGVVDVSSGNEDKNAQLQVSLDRQKLKRLGLSELEVGQAIRASFASNIVGVFETGATQQDISMRVNDISRQSIKDLENLQIYLKNGQRITLASVANFELKLVGAAISRYNKERELKFTSNVNDIPLGVVQKVVDENINSILPQGYSYRFTGFIELMNETNEAFVFTILLSVVLIYMILAALYESFLMPIVVMISMPLAFGGVAVGLFLSGNSFSLFVMVGVILLFGMVGKNAILVVDFANRFAKDGMPVDEAVLKAGKLRLKAILMTTLAMIFAMLPLALSKGAGYEGNSPMAIAVIFGLISSTILTLLIVPAMFGLVFKIDKWIKRFYERPYLS